MKKRKRLGKTNYYKRERLLKKGKPRLVARFTDHYIITQLIEYNPTGDKTLASAYSKELRDYGWKASFKNIPAAYLTGFLLGCKAKLKEAVFDTGFRSKGDRLYAVLKGAIDAGLKVPHDPKSFPLEERIKGKHIAQFTEKPKDKQRFSTYLKKKLDPADLPKHFEKIKMRIEKKWKM